MGKKFSYSSNGRGCGCGIGCGCGCCGGGPIAKFLLILFNILFLGAGVILVAFGIWMKAANNFASLQDLVDSGLDDDTLSKAGLVLIGFGAFVAIVSAFGFLATCCAGNKGLITLYCLFLFVILCCGIGAAIGYGLIKTKIDSALSGALTKSLAKYQPENDLATDWDYVQTWIKCCGPHGPKDYKNVSLTKADMHVPITCCVLTNSDAKHPHPLNETQCQLDANKFQYGNLTSSSVLKTTGCYESIGDYIESKLGIIIGVGVAISTLQMLGICLAIGILKDDGYGQF